MSRHAWTLGLATALALAQQVSPPPPQEPVLRINVNLVQVDAVVTDSHGRQVTDLTADDFEIFEDGRSQKITAFSYVKTAAPPPAPAKPPVPANAPGAPRPPTAPLEPRQVRRTIVLMVDDLGLSFESTYYVRRALKKFVDEQMLPGDLVAILRTSAGMGSLQQFTVDKAILNAAIDRVHWNPMGRGGVSAFAALGSDPLERLAVLAGSRPQGRRTGGAPAMQDPGTLDDFRDENFMLGTLGAITFVVRALRDLPGRKAVILFSDGIPLFLQGQERARIVDPMRALTDLANRAAVILYTIDARGLQTLALTAEDHPALSGGGAGDTLAGALSSRSRQFFESQQGMEYLAYQTGGFFIHDSNDLAGGVRRIMGDLAGYYLIGYKPDESSFTPDKGYHRFHKIQVKVKVRGLEVRSRTGYIGVPDEETRPVYRTRVEQMAAALVSPFHASDLKLRLTCLFSEVPKTGAVVRSLLHIDARGLTFTEEADGLRKTVIDLAAFVFGEEGVPVSSADRMVTLRLSPEEYAQARSGGFLYTMNVALQKPGAYQVRAAVRDSASEKIGSASQFLEVPDVRKHQLALSGIILNGEAPKISEAGASPAKEDYTLASSGSPAVRLFQPGQVVHYTYVIFNAQVDKKTRRPDLETQVLLYRDAKPVFTGSRTLFKTGQHTDLSRLIAAGAIRLGASIEPGEYMLQIAAWDRLAPKKRCLAVQWTDLEIAR